MIERTPWIIIGVISTLLALAILRNPANAEKFRGTHSSNYRSDDDMVWKGSVTDSGIILDTETHPEGGPGIFLRGVEIRCTTSGGPSSQFLYGDLGAPTTAEIDNLDWELKKESFRAFTFYGTKIGLKATPGDTLAYEVVGLR